MPKDTEELQNEQEWLTIPEATALVGVSKQHLYNIAARRNSPFEVTFINRGKALRDELHISKASLLAWQEKRNQGKKTEGTVESERAGRQELALAG